MALGALAADATRDPPSWSCSAVRARELVARSEPPDPILRLLVAAVDAALAAAVGDLDTALAALEQPISGLRPGDRAEALVRLHWHRGRRRFTPPGPVTGRARPASGSVVNPLVVWSD